MWPLEMQNDDAGDSRGVLADAVRNGDDGGWLEPPAYQIEDNAKPSLSVNSVIEFTTPLPQRHPTLRSPLLTRTPARVCVANMLSTTRSAASMALRGASREPASRPFCWS
jgi:hypothetical protein